MTCIVGVIDKQDVYLGADSAGVSDMDLTVRKDKKVFTLNGFIIGFTTSFRMGQILQYKLQPPPHKATCDIFRYMATDVIDAIRSCFKDAGYLKKENEREEGGLFLVGYRGRLFRIDPDFQVGEGLNNFAAVGCGWAYALGALHAAPKNMPASKKVHLALSAADRFSTGVSKPFVIKRLKHG